MEREAVAGRTRPTAFRTFGCALCLAMLLAGAVPSAAQSLSFTEPAFVSLPGSSPFSVAIGDFNGDSDPDLAIPGAGISILLGTEAGSFTDPTSFTVGSDPRSVAIGDFDGDSDTDLAVANETSNNVSILLGAAGGSFTGPTNFAVGSSLPWSIAIGDFNADSDPDLVVANRSTASNNVSILLGAAGGSFTGPTNVGVESGPRSVAVGDFNGDSDPDLAVANELSDNVSILLGAAGGSFVGSANLPVGDGPRSVAIGDFNGDSDPDLAVANGFSRSVSILPGGAGATFGAATNHAVRAFAWSVAASDLDGDSDPDLAVANEAVIAVFTGAAGADFTARTEFSAGRPDLGGVGAISVVAGDFDGDSDLDLAAGRAPGDVSILLNTTGAPPAPQLTDTDPDSPAHDSSPFVKGEAEAGSTVRLYKARTTADCKPVNLAATGTAAAFATPGLQVSVASDSTTRFRATATNAAGNSSGCSPSSITYVEVSSPPEPPTFTGTDPPSGLDHNSPLIKGAAAPGSQVELFDNPTCAGSPVQSGSAEAFASPGLQVSVPDNSSTTFYAKATLAGFESICSPTSITYVEITLEPGPESESFACPPSTVPPGATYVGRHSAGGPICFTVSAGWSAVTSFLLVDVPAGDVCFILGQQTFFPLPIAIGARSFGGGKGGTEIGGSFDAGRGASGTFRVRVPDCDTGVVSWRASTTATPPWALPRAVAATDTKAPALRLRARSSQRAVRQKGIVVEIACPTERCTATARGTVSVPGAARTYRLKPATKQIPRGGKTKVKLRFTEKALTAVKRALRKHRRVRARVTVSVKDAAGNRTVERRSIRVRR